MNIRHISPLLLVALIGCAVGPDYQKPATPTPQNWTATETPASTGESAIDHAWWQNFNDPTLTQLITKAVSGNFDLKIATARIAEARASSSNADAALLPTGDVGFSGNRQGNRLAFPGGSASGLSSLLKKPFNTFQLGFDASWELDLFGGHRREAEAANAEVEASLASRDDVMVSMMAEVARTYVEIRQYQAQLKIVQDTIAADQKTLDIAKERFNAGDVAGIDVTQAEAQLKQAETQLPTTRDLLAQSEYSMDVLLGEQPGATQKLVGNDGPVPATNKNLVLAAPAAVIANRPDIRMAERNLASATAQQGAALAKFFPDISLTGFFGLLNTNAGNLLSAGSKSWMMGGNVLWPILSYGSLSANLDAANAQQQEAMATYQKSVISALSDVEKTLSAYTEQEKFRQSQAEALAANQHAFEIAQQRYKEGLTSFLDVLDAQRTLNMSAMQMNDATAKSSANLIAVYKSLGGGWKSK